jgi:hypothetical protein
LLLTLPNDLHLAIEAQEKANVGVGCKHDVPKNRIGSPDLQLSIANCQLSIPYQKENRP